MEIFILTVMENNKKKKKIANICQKSPVKEADLKQWDGMICMIIYVPVSIHLHNLLLYL